MTFSDIFRESFLESFNTGDFSFKHIGFILLITTVLAAYIFLVYRFITKKTFYNKNFNISVAAIAVIVAAIIITIQSSIVISLGMVGALSIVRFRTAIKDPMDLVFLFWSISIGIICGAGLFGIAILTSLVLTVGIVVLELLPIAKAPLLLVINANDKAIKEAVIEKIKQNTKTYQIKSQTVNNNRLDMIIEVKTKEADQLLDTVSSIEGIEKCSLIRHDGETAF
ncbi:MAG: DUF4956 domain-containing protein [Eubacterium sp.]|nr:DUF4956 domain-containing protein [Eubacterium sp.]